MAFWNKKKSDVESPNLTEFAMGEEHGLAGLPPIVRQAPEEAIYYHVAPRSGRDSILIEGLQGQTGDYPSPWDRNKQRASQPLGNYMFSTYEDAERYANERNLEALSEKPPDSETFFDYGIAVTPGDKNKPNQPEAYVETYSEENDDWDERPFDPNGDDIYLLPTELQGWDIWKVTPKMGTVIQGDPELNLVDNEEGSMLPEAIQDVNVGTFKNVYPDTTPMRQYSENEITPDELELVKYFAPWEAHDESYYETRKKQEVPEPIARVPWQTYVGKLFKRTNILDPILPMLDPTVWDESQSPQPSLKKEHRIWIFEFITRALHSKGYTHTDEWLSLVLTGSLTTYQYSPGSDCDISLFISVDHLPDWSRAEMIGIMTELCDGTLLPGTSHPLQCYVVDPEFKKEDLYQPGLRSGYDIDNNKWIVPPEKNRAHDVKQELNSLYVGALEGADKMERLLRYEPDKAVMYYKQIHSRRKRDMEAGKGDYSSSNIIYKMLEARNLLDRVHDLMPEAKAYDSGDD